MPSKIAIRAVLIAAATSLVIPASAQVQRSFSGETVNLELSAGTYWVTASYDGRVRVLPRTRADQVSVRLNVDTFGRRADVAVRGPNDGFDADIELPRRVNLIATLAAGALRMRGIDGSKNITAKTGEIEIELGDRHQYARLMATVETGAVNLPGFKDAQPRLRSFEWKGRGSDDLSVRINTGTITLRD